MRGKMNTAELTQEISAKDVDVDKFVQLAIDDDHIKDEIIRQMVTHPHIIVYYHCYYVASKASQERPELFYQYWRDVASLLNHRNSYHRDFGLTIIANLTKVDQENLFSKIFHDYFEHINDEKFMTGQCCVQNSIKILRHKPELKDQIIALLLDVDNQCTYTEKQKGVLKCDVLEIFAEIYEEVQQKDDIDEFIRTEVSSISPKTRKKAKELVRKYGL
jgi:hypothetical protein